MGQTRGAASAQNNEVGSITAEGILKCKKKKKKQTLQVKSKGVSTVEGGPCGDNKADCLQLTNDQVSRSTVLCMDPSLMVQRQYEPLNTLL